MTEPLVSFVVTCMGRLAHVQKCLHSIVGQPRSEAVFVDYSCPEKSGEWVEANYPQVRVVRVPDRKLFNKCEALNAGVAAARGSWVAIVDADCQLRPHFTERIVGALKPGEFAAREARSSLQSWVGGTGFVVFERGSKARFDEALGAIGFGDEDHDFCWQLIEDGKNPRSFNSSWCLYLDHGDAARTAHYDKDIDAARPINRAYLDKKRGHRESHAFDTDAADPIREKGARPRLLMVQPGLHGDAILCAPIAKWYADHGWEVVWPTFSTWTYRALWDHFDYVTPVYFNKVGNSILDDIYRMADSLEFDKVLYLWVNVPGTRAHRPDLEHTNFVAAKYGVAAVPVEERWNFQYTRRPEREAKVYREVVESRGHKPGGYAVVHDETWCGSASLGVTALPVVRLEAVEGCSILDWRLVLEGAGEIRCIDSSLSNLVEVLPSCAAIPKTLLRKSDWLGTPPYRNGWKFLPGCMEQDVKQQYLVEDCQIEVPRKLVVHDPPLRRGQARVMICRRASGEITEADGGVVALPDLLRGYETWVNVSRARRLAKRITFESGHVLDIRLVRDRGADALCAIEGPKDLVEGARAWLPDGKPVKIGVQYRKYGGVYSVRFGDGAEWVYRGAADGERRQEEGLLATVPGSVYDDYSSAHLDDETLRMLRVRRLVYHADLSAYETPPVDREDTTHEPHPERFRLLDPFERAWRCAVGLQAMKALEMAARGVFQGERGLFLTRGHEFLGVDAWLTPLMLPVEMEFYALAAFVGVETACKVVKYGVDKEFGFYHYGDLLLVI
jgi:glycosyltransferase involved in cell wall biosynthesis